MRQIFASSLIHTSNHGGKAQVAGQALNRRLSGYKSSVLTTRPEGFDLSQVAMVHN